MTEKRKPVSLSQRWRREVTRDIDPSLLDEAVETMPTIRQSLVRINKGSIHAELEGLMGSIHEVHIHAPVLPSKIWIKQPLWSPPRAMKMPGIMAKRWRSVASQIL